MCNGCCRAVEAQTHRDIHIPKHGSAMKANEMKYILDLTIILLNKSNVNSIYINSERDSVRLGDKMTSKSKNLLSLMPG